MFCSFGLNLLFLSFNLSFHLDNNVNVVDNISSIYTSGRKCNFQNKGCDADHLQPININGWFWADGESLSKLKNQTKVGFKVTNLE